ncbi:MAG: FAD:protein FMN transferase [Tissierellaceae bacterium]
MKRDIRKLAILVLALGLFLTGCTADSSQKLNYISKTDFLMDTVMTVRIYDNQKDKILDKVFERLKEIEDRMSSHIEASDVSKINDNAGIQPVTVNSDTYEVIKRAIFYAELSKGNYDPTIGSLVDLWDVKAEEKERDFIPGEKEIEEARSLVGYEDLELLDNNQVYLKRKGMKLVLGSIVKGYAADEARRILIENKVEKAIVDLGGNLFIHGEKDQGVQWLIGIQDPFNPTGSYAGVVEVSDKSVVTSGDYERFFTFEGKRYNHIIDPYLGYPADNDLTGISIISDKSIDGDALSTTVFVMGLDEGMDFVNGLEDIEAIFISKDKSIYVTEKLKGIFNLPKESPFTIKDY